MLLPLLFFAQLAVARDSTYSTEALRAMVSRAVIANHVPPPAFRGCHAHVESEISLLLRDTLGRERAAQLEQLASSIQWQRGGAYEMHVIGYRTQGLGSPFSALTYIRGWTEPSLYGERLRLGAQLFADSARRRDSTRTDTIIAVHPFASDRDRFYRFTGGDTVTVLRSGNRAISVVRVHVTPHLRDSTRLAAFEGEIDLDGERGQIVRMRGQFMVLGPFPGRRPLLARIPGLVGVAYCEFVNTEVNGQYWLPAFQRTELQSTFAMLGKSRAVMRILSTFSDYSVDDTSTAAIATGDVNRIPRRTTWASTDSVSRYGDWRASLGDATASVTANDFDDVAPDVWKTTGSPRLDFIPTSFDNAVRFDRVEGLYTGLEANLYMRSVVPGLTLGALGGVAWSEHMLRGGAHVSLQRDLWTVGARAERTLATTNDFIRPFDPQNGGLAALFGSFDDFDYVDRRVAVGTVTRVLGSVENAFVTMQLGAGDDRAERARLSHGVFGGSFRPNRGVSEGTYALGIMDLEIHPSISGDFVQPGVGAKVHLEAGRGDLTWQRAELTLSAIKYHGAVALSAEASGGVVFGSIIPPQTLFELGGTAGLPGYDYKEFAGNHAALFRSHASYSFPVWRVPHRVRGNLTIPGLAPGLAIGVQGGWTEISNDAARIAVDHLGASWSPGPISHATNGIRATAGFGVTLFNGFVHFGVARPIDTSAPWKLTLGLGPLF
jgi:hypothetical protein